MLFLLFRKMSFYVIILYSIISFPIMKCTTILNKHYTVAMVTKLHKYLLMQIAFIYIQHKQDYIMIDVYCKHYHSSINTKTEVTHFPLFLHTLCSRVQFLRSSEFQVLTSPGTLDFDMFIHHCLEKRKQFFI